MGDQDFGDSQQNLKKKQGHDVPRPCLFFDQAMITSSLRPCPCFQLLLLLSYPSR
jgi:hypothetical protein